MKLLIIISLFISQLAFADDDFHLLDLNEIKLTYIDYFPGGRDPIISNNGLPNREPGKLLDASITTDVLKYGYWRSLVHSETDSYVDTKKDGQFRLVGLNMEIGVHVTPAIDVFYWHYSKHLLDTTSDNIGGFPVEDGVGINITIFSKNKREGIINWR